MLMGTAQFRLESAESTQQLRRELVVIDSTAGNYQQLVDDILVQQSDSRQFDVFILDNGRDGVEQISAILAGHGEVDALHIVSHGTEGRVKLGSTWLSLDNVGGHAGQLVAWRDGLSMTPTSSSTAVTWLPTRTVRRSLNHLAR